MGTGLYSGENGTEEIAVVEDANFAIGSYVPIRCPLQTLCQPHCRYEIAILLSFADHVDDANILRVAAQHFEARCGAGLVEVERLGLDFVLCPRGRHNIAFYAARVNPPRQAGKIKLHEPVQYRRIGVSGENEMDLAARAIAPAGPSDKVVRMRDRWRPEEREPRHALCIHHQDVVRPWTLWSSIGWYSKQNVEALAPRHALVKSYFGVDLHGTAAHLHEEMEEMQAVNESLSMPEKKVAERDCESTRALGAIGL